MILYIVRHAIAEPRDSNASLQEDSRRPLTDDGRKKMRRIAKALRQMGVQIDLIIASPYLRAADTARILQKQFDLPDDKFVVMEHLSPDGDPARLIQEINGRFGNSESVALVGHEPGLSRLISVLLSGHPTIPITLRKGGVCELTVDSLEYSRCATLQWLLAPAQLMQIGV